MKISIALAALAFTAAPLLAPLPAQASHGPRYNISSRIVGAPAPVIVAANDAAADASMGGLKLAKADGLASPAPTFEIGESPSPVPADLGAAANELPAIVQAVQSGKTMVAVAMALGLLIFLFERFGKQEIPSAYIQWALLAASVLTAIATSLYNGTPIVAALLAAIPAALSGISTYHVLDEHTPAPTLAGAKA